MQLLPPACRDPLHLCRNPTLQYIEIFVYSNQEYLIDSNEIVVNQTSSFSRFFILPLKSPDFLLSYACIFSMIVVEEFRLIPECFRHSASQDGSYTIQFCEAAFSNNGINTVDAVRLQ